MHHAPTAALLLPAFPLLAGGGGAGPPTADLMTCWPGSRLQLARNQAGNPNLDNGIPDIRILAHRTRSAFGFGIPFWDVFIPREIHIEHGYARTSQSHHHVCHRLITTSANVCQHQITTSGHQGVVRKHMERQGIDGREPEPTGANRRKPEPTGGNRITRGKIVSIGSKTEYVRAKPRKETLAGGSVPVRVLVFVLLTERERM